MSFVKIKTEKCIPRIVDEVNLTFFAAMVFAVLFGFASRLPFYSGTCSGGRRRLKVGCNMILWLFHHLCWSVNLRGHHYWTCGPISNVTKMWHENRFRKWTLLCREKGFLWRKFGTMNMNGHFRIGTFGIWLWWHGSERLKNHHVVRSCQHGDTGVTRNVLRTVLCTLRRGVVPAWQARCPRNFALIKWILSSSPRAGPVVWSRTNVSLPVKHGFSCTVSCSMVSSCGFNSPARRADVLITTV